MKRLRPIFLLLLTLPLLTAALPAAAQHLPRGQRTIIRGGMRQRPDSLRLRADSLLERRLRAEADSLFAADFRADSAMLALHRTDDLATLDSIALAEFETGGIRRDSTRRLFRKGWFMQDSMGLSKVCWMSALVPGYGQIYNRQYLSLIHI